MRILASRRCIAISIIPPAKSGKLVCGYRKGRFRLDVLIREATKMGKMGNGYGSEFHLLRYLGYPRHGLNRAVENKNGGRVSDWLDFPTGGEGKLDMEWKGVDFVDSASGVKSAWVKFWPQTGNPSESDQPIMIWSDFNASRTLSIPLGAIRSTKACSCLVRFDWHANRTSPTCCEEGFPFPPPGFCTCTTPLSGQVES